MIALLPGNGRGIGRGYSCRGRWKSAISQHERTCRALFLPSVAGDLTGPIEEMPADLAALPAQHFTRREYSGGRSGPVGSRSQSAMMVKLSQDVSHRMAYGRG